MVDQTESYFCEYERRGGAGPGTIVLVFQGGGALGAYQAGVYEAMRERGIEPDWLVGTSIGAINASLIACNAAERRVPAMREFWRRVEDKSLWHGWPMWPQLGQSMSYLATLQNGIPGFFRPNPLAILGPHYPMAPENTGYYSTIPLEQTLQELTDFALLGGGGPRLTVGAAHVRSSRMHYFDSRDIALSAKHILASGALPPAFPAVRIDGELYWDGGILSNTPTEVVFDDEPRRDALIFSVHMWNPEGPEPKTLWEVAHRQKDIQYSSRIASQIVRLQQSHRLRHVIAELFRELPETQRHGEAAKALAAYGCLTQMHVVRLLAPRLEHEDQTKDVDFTPAGIKNRWQAGFADMMAALDAAPWRTPVQKIEGVILHEPGPDGWARGSTSMTDARAFDAVHVGR